jgi:hypothetical protein
VATAFVQVLRQLAEETLLEKDRGDGDEAERLRAVETKGKQVT